MNDLVFDICRVLVTIAGLVVAYYVVPALKSTIAKIEDEKLKDFISQCVYAAQQQFSKETDTGKAKYNYVQQMVSDWLRNRGIEISERQLKMLIESAVLTMKSEIK